MANQDEALRVALERYKSARKLSLIFSLVFVVVGIAGIVLAVTGKLAESAQRSSVIFEKLGPQGVMIAGIVVFTLLALAGVVGTYRIRRDWESGYQLYAAQMEKDLTSGADVR